MPKSLAYVLGAHVNCLIEMVLLRTQTYNLVEKEDNYFLARLYEVQRTIVVITIIRVPVPFRSPHTALKFSFLEVHILTTTNQEAFILAS